MRGRTRRSRPDTLTAVRLLLLFSSRIRGGAEEYALTIARHALAEGWEVHAAFPVCAGTTSVVDDCARAGIRAWPLDIAESQSGRDDDWRSLIRHARNSARTRQVLDVVRPDVVHVQLAWPTFCYGSLQALRSRRCPAVVTFHLVPEQLRLSPRRQRAYARLRAAGQHWVAISEHGRQLIASLFDISAEQLTLIYNGVRMSEPASGIARAAARDAVRQELGLRASSRILLSVGRLVEQKGYTVLIPAIAGVLRAHPDATFVWAGEGEQRQELVERLAAHGVSQHVIMTGQRRDVPRLMLAADVFVFPTRYEGLPFVLLEAMASRLPVVASDAASIPEVITNGRDGILFPSGDSAALEAALLDVLSDEARALGLARSAEARLSQFSEKRMARSTLDLLRAAARSAA